MKPLRFRAFVVAAMAPLVIAAPGIANASARTAGISSAAHRYLVDSAPVGNASTAFQSAVISWMSNPTVTGPEAESAARPLISALVAFQHKLGSQTWPSDARDDIHALVSAFNGLLGDLRALSHDDIADTSSWEGPFLSEDVSTTAACRHSAFRPSCAGLVAAYPNGFQVAKRADTLCGELATVA
jgi:hypothetical protein